MQPIAAHLQIPTLVPSTGVPKEFAQAARDAIERAAPLLKLPELALALRHVPDGYPWTNIYLSRGLKFMGFTAAIKDNRRALQRRRQVFTQVNDIWWAISFNREQKTAVAHHRAGYRARFIAH